AITNNIVSSLPQDGIDIASATTSNNPTLDYNLYNGNANVLRWAGTAYNTIANVRSGTGREAHGVAGSPQFISTSSAPPDLHIQSTSAAVGVATNLSTSFTMDYDGVTRPSAWDIGADQLASGRIIIPPHAIDASYVAP